VTTWHRLLTLTLLASFSAFLLAAPRAEAATPDLKARIDSASLRLQDLRAQLASARAALQAALPTNAPGALQQARAQIASVKPQVVRLLRQIRHWRWVLAHPMQPAANGSWLPVIRAAASGYRLSVTGLFRMMSLESGGRARAVGGGGLFFGLFQYWSPTWRAAWNPFRAYSIFNGGAQIWATAYAIHHGYAWHMWPNTYRLAFGTAAR
jgi:hypothetical protein